jgi:TPR repeat protein
LGRFDLEQIYGVRLRLAFRAAAELGHGHAQLMLGRYLASGAAGKHSGACRLPGTVDREARRWLERAVAQGIPEAEVDLAELTSPNNNNNRAKNRT